MKSYERESFIKTFTIFFLSMFLVATVVVYFYNKEQKHTQDEQLFEQMKSFTYDFKAQSFSLDVVPYRKGVDELGIQACEEGMCAYFRIESAPMSMFKVVLDKERYLEIQNALWFKLMLIYALAGFAIVGFAFVYSLYALAPLRKALRLKEEFLKDVVHDLNTPVTSILLNTKALAKKGFSEELERIELGAKSIVALYHNLEIAYKAYVPSREKIDLQSVLQERVKVFQKLYPRLHFSFKTNSCVIQTDHDALCRILDNILSNACKYNRKNGRIEIFNDENTVCIKDSGVGIKRCDLVYQRYYKESERGLGLGLNIVKTLCDSLGIDIEIKSKEGEGTSVFLRFAKEEQKV